MGDEEQADRSFRAAIQTAPGFADAYASLAAIRIRQGETEQAVALQRHAVQLAASLQRYQRELAAYEVLLAAGCGAPMPGDSETQTALREPRSGEAPSADRPDLAARIARLDWRELESRLTDRGFAHAPGLLGAGECETLRAMFEEASRFAKQVTMDKSRFGKGVYRYFAAPVPPLVDAVRRLVYPHVAEIANRWQRLLEREESYPTTWPEFRARCAAAGQTTPSPILLRYEAGGFNALHQDLRGEVFFPVQLVIVLSPRAESASSDASGFTGGEFLFCDQPERKQSDRRAIPAGLGDAILFCTRARLVRVGGVYGLKPVTHGLNRIASGIRYALGLPFHEFA